MPELRSSLAAGERLAHDLDGGLDLDGLAHLADPEARTQLMKITGIGAWTADIYLLMALGRPDIWPQGDLALELAIQRAKGLEEGDRLALPEVPEQGQMEGQFGPGQGGGVPVAAGQQDLDRIFRGVYPAGRAQ